MNKALEDGIEKACLAKIEEPTFRFGVMGRVSTDIKNKIVLYIP